MATPSPPEVFAAVGVIAAFVGRFYAWHHGQRRRQRSLTALFAVFFGFWWFLHFDHPSRHGIAALFVGIGGWTLLNVTMAEFTPDDVGAT
ncbi:hypothetical protein JCM30237_07030 [Halolamina litorea]|jgi:dolichol kinase|uniref:Uncharacterized protein n=1 Tax=Halolamina litorea TaxID=1515593 RepID=A0ABD6BR53_9EURY|nr:hypothetical protein [Halolamina litorea]